MEERPSLVKGGSNDPWGTSVAMLVRRQAYDAKGNAVARTVITWIGRADKAQVVRPKTAKARVRLKADIRDLTQQALPLHSCFLGFLL